MKGPLSLTLAVAVALLAVSPSAGHAQTERITVEFDNTPLRQVLNQFAVHSGRTIVLNSEVGNPTVSASIHNMEWHRSLNSILEAHGLAAHPSTGGIIVVRRQPRITVQFINASLRDVVTNFGTFAGRTIVLPADLGDLVVNGRVDDTDWKRAFDGVLATHGLAAVQDDATGIIRVERKNPKAVTPPPDSV